MLAVLLLFCSSDSAPTASPASSSDRRTIAGLGRARCPNAASRPARSRTLDPFSAWAPRFMDSIACQGGARFRKREHQSCPHWSSRRDTRARFPTLNTPVSGKLRFRARHAGTFRLAVFVQSSANDPGSLIEVPVAPAPASATGAWGWVGPAAGAALLIAGVALFAVALRRRRTASR
jgi:hypothetical protein